MGHSTKRLTQEEFEERVEKINDHIIVLGKYVNRRSKVKIKCKKCGYEQEVSATYLLQKRFSCKKCNEKINSNEKFIEKIKELYPNIRILTEWKSASEKVEIEFKDCGHHRFITPNKLLNKKRKTECLECSGKVFNRTTKIFKKEIKEINPDIEIIGEYVNIGTKIQCKCKICGREWGNTPDHLLSGQRCPDCARKHLASLYQKPEKQFKEELYEINKDVVIIGNYVNNKTKIKCKCDICGNIWEVTPDNLLKGKGCPKCRISHGEREIANILDKNNLKYEIQYAFSDCKHKRVLRFDFYLPNENVVIEFDGLQHFFPVNFKKGVVDEETLKEFEKIEIRDKIKDDYCKDKGIKIIRIPYWDFNKIEHILQKQLINI